MWKRFAGILALAAVAGLGACDNDPPAEEAMEEAEEAMDEAEDMLEDAPEVVPVPVPAPTDTLAADTMGGDTLMRDTSATTERGEDR